ncbi:hypothetical protein BH23BAC3_BH23BAC3_15630 [soil metagenome]
MKQSLSILVLSVVIVRLIGAPLAVAQTDSTSLDVVLTNAYDAFGHENNELKHDFGFSTIVEYNGKTILFDAGTDAKIFESNLKALKIDVSKVDIAIVSHGHYDHIGGFDYLLS